MAIRLEQKTIEAWKNSMKDFLPQYLENDYDLPKEYAINFNFLWESE